MKDLRRGIRRGSVRDNFCCCLSIVTLMCVRTRSLNNYLEGT